MSLSAADLQKRHELEGAPDPFPSLGPAIPSKPKVQTPTSPDTSSESAFPSLASTTSTSNPVTSSAWGPRIKSTGQKAPVFADSFTLGPIDLSSSGKDGYKPTTLGHVMRQVMAKYKVKIDASANQRAQQTTFHLKAESQKELDKAKRSLLSLLSPVITIVIDAPSSTIASIIGPRGTTLKQIRDQTSVRVDIPKKDSTTPTVNGHASGTVDDEEESTVPITLVGPQPLALEAEALLKDIISSKRARSMQYIRSVPRHILPFIVVRKAAFASAQVDFAVDIEARSCTVSGDRDAVGQVMVEVKQLISDLETSLTPVKVPIPKRQHRLLLGVYADDVMRKSNCAVLVTEGNEVTVWGRNSDVCRGLEAVLQQANSKYIYELALPGPTTHSTQLATYFTRIHYDKVIKHKHSGVDAFLPPPQGTALSIDLVGNKEEVDAVAEQISSLLEKMTGATREVNVDWLLHRVIIAKNAKRLKQLHDTYNVQAYFPDDSVELSQILLVYDPMSPAAAVSLDEKIKRLDIVEIELVKLARDAADVKTEFLSIEKRWHEAVVGKGRTTLNAIIGEDIALSIKVGTEVVDRDTEDVILVRGSSSEVDRAVRDILRIVEDAKKDEIVNSFSTEFDVDREYVGRIVGAQGVGINKLREQLGVKVDVSDDVDEKEKEGGKKKKATHQKSRVKITGRKENVEEAKKRVLAQVERLADDISEILKIPAQYHSSLIGHNGKYAIRLEEKYGVKIAFPRHSSEGDSKREQLRVDEVLVKGGKKGVAGAKSELLEALEYEKETNNVLKFSIPTRSVARVLGKGGASINQIKNQTEAMIEIDKGSSDDGKTTVITLRGTKKAILAAKTAILSISDQVAEETTVSIFIENKYHRNIIGAGGQGLKELIAKCGGPPDVKQQAGSVRFPRHGDPSDEVRLRGDPKTVARLKTELEKIVGDLRDRVVLGVDVPVAHHRALIGRGGQNLSDLQTKFNVHIQLPGSRSYDQAGVPENISDLSSVDPASLVKVSGSRAACEEAIAELKVDTEVTKTVTVPLKYHHAISQQGGFLRSLRHYGVFVDHSVLPTRSAIPSRPTPSARIDDAELSEPEWETQPNYQDADQGDTIWTLKARDQAALERAEKSIQDAVDYAAQMNLVGFLTFPDRSTFPKIVGTKGVNIARLRSQTGADITVGRENSTIVIIGAEAHVVAAKDAILRMTNRRSRRHDI